MDVKLDVLKLDKSTFSNDEHPLNKALIDPTLDALKLDKFTFSNDEHPLNE